MENTKKWISICIIMFIVGALIGYLLGYMAGAKAIVNYAVKFVDQIKVEKINIEVNGSQLDTVLGEIQQITHDLNQRLNNISMT